MTQGKKNETKTNVKKGKRDLDSTKDGEPSTGSKIWSGTKKAFVGFSGVTMNLSSYLFKVGAAVVIIGLLIEITGLGVLAVLGILFGVAAVFGGIYHGADLMAKAKEFTGTVEEVPQAA